MNIIKKTIILTFLILLPISSFSQSNIDIKTVSQKLDYFLKLANTLRMQSNIPGVGIALVYEGEIIYRGGLGYRDIENKKPVTENTLFPIGSTTKSFTGVIASKLVEKNLLDWNEPVKKYYSEFEVVDDYVTNYTTVKDLFTHMTGVGRYDLLYYHNPSIKRAEILSKLSLMESKYPFRQQYAYNNFMYLVAGIVEEKVSGKSWDTLINEEIFAPLKMNSSFTSFQQYFNHKEKSKGYKIDKKTEVNYQNIDVIAPAGSISSTPHDMALWIQMLTNKGKVENNYFLTEDQFNYLTGAHAPFNPSRSLSMSIGWLMIPYNGQRLIQKDGAIDGFQSKITVVTEKFGIAIIANTWTDYVSLITDYALNIFVDDKFERNYKLEKSLEYKKPIKADTINEIPLLHSQNEYIGTYDDELYGVIMISEKNKGLYFKFHDFESKMEYTGFDNFRVILDLGSGSQAFNLHIHTNFEGEINQIDFKIEDGMSPSIFVKRKKNEIPNKN